MKALLLWPKFESNSFWNFESVCTLAGVKYMSPPLGILTVAGMLPSDWQVRVVDENVRLTDDADIEWADVVFMGSKIVSRNRATDLIRKIKAAGLKVAVGGADATLSWQAYQDAGADYVCIGEAELLVPMLLAALASSAPPTVLRADGMADLLTTPVPRFDLVDLHDYLYVGIQYSRGCPYSCEFCNVIDIFDGYRTKSTAQVLAELSALYDAGYRGQVDFFDDNFVGNMKKAKAMLGELADWLDAHRHPFQFSTSVTLNVAKDEELLKLLRRARFKYFLVGIETPSEEALTTAQKGQNVGFSIEEAVQRIYTVAGATVHSGFLIGMDGEPSDIADRVVRCIDATSIPWIMGSIVYPLPGTQLSRRLDREGRLFAGARVGLPLAADGKAVRDQISAGIQFVTERPPVEVLDDLLRILEHSYAPERYFDRCAAVACQLDTLPTLMPGARIFARNLRTAVRMAAHATRTPSIRLPFWRAVLKVAWRNPRGMEAMFTLAVLYTHFAKMLPYCEGALQAQRRAIEGVGVEAWYATQLATDAGVAANA